jgi:beta-xylosidase
VSLCIYLWLIFLCAFQTHAQTYKNPVIPGDFPDPSVIRVGNDYYATATSGGWSPEFPILHSTDLINWKTIGAVFYDKPAWAKGDFWAPEIIADKGRYFVYYTARRDDGKDKKGTLCVAVAVADKPAGHYTDKGTLVCQEMGSIDAFFVRDENGKPFLSWKEDGNDRGKPTWLYAQELDESGTKLLGKPYKLFRNTEPWENHVIEGTYILRRDGWFYLFYSGNACCGRSCDYALGVARSKTLLGKWEKNPANPILKANDLWQCPGHGSLVKTPDGRDFLLYHAYRKGAIGFIIGREALLDEVKFQNGWATINDGRGASNGANVPLKNSEQNQPKVFLDEFSNAALNPVWEKPLGSRQIERLVDGFLTLTAEPNQNDEIMRAAIAQRNISGDFTATTLIKTVGINSNENIGLASFGWIHNAIGVSVGGKKIFVWLREDNKLKIINTAPQPESAQIYLQMTVRGGEFYRFAFSLDGQKWTNLGEPVGTINGGRIALVYGGKENAPQAKFDWLRIEQR